jgi:hypothetical protein
MSRLILWENSPEIVELSASLTGFGAISCEITFKIVKKRGSARTRIKENVFVARILREDEEILTIISQFLFLEG